MNTVCIVQARITSTRLPGKVMYHLAGKPVIHHVLERAKQIQGVDLVVVAAPDDVRSQVIADAARDVGIETFYGSELDVLERYYFVALNLKADKIVRITADCPLIDPVKCSKVVDLLQDADYASNCYPRMVPKGHDCEIFTFAALDVAHKQAVGTYAREHVTPFMISAMKTYCLAGNYQGNENYCLDTPADYLRLKELMG